MTLDHILSGPVTDRPNGAPYPMTEAEARGVLREIEARMPRKRRGPTVRKLVDAAESGLGNLSRDAIALYRKYATAYGA